MCLQTAISSASIYLPRLLRIDLAELCDGYSWAHVLLNFYDGGDAPRSSLPRCVRVTRYPWFKTFFWFMAIPPEVAVRYSHIFLVDSDMVLRPSKFALPTMMRLQEAVNVSVMAPAVYGHGQPSYHMLDGPRCHKTPFCDCDDQGNHRKAHCDMARPESCNPHTKCTVCRNIMVEVKAPLFTSIAWQAVHIVILQSYNLSSVGRKAPERLWSSDFFIDTQWCSVVNHYVHGTAPILSPTPESRLDGQGLACAVSYATPMHDLDTRSERTSSQAESIRITFQRSFAAAKRARNEFQMMQAAAHAAASLKVAMLWEYAVSPTWRCPFLSSFSSSLGTPTPTPNPNPNPRPRKTALALKPCWNASELAHALEDPGLPQPFKLSALPPYSPREQVPEWQSRSKACRMPAYSAIHSSRPLMWCGGSHGSMSGPWSKRAALLGDPPSTASNETSKTGPPSTASNETCMLTPVYAAHFHHLEKRLLETARFAVGEVPTTVVVFDDAIAHAAFCTRHPKGCGGEVKMYPLNLKAMLGDDKYAVARSMLASGNWRQRELRRNRTFGNDPLSFACAPKFGGQCYQSLKKYYGAAEGPCSRYWVSDAETFPFRMYRWSQLVKVAWPSERRPFLVVPSWYPDRWGCTYTQDDYSDSSCGVWTASRLKLASFPDFTVSETDVQKKMWQSRFDLNNWWLYDQRTARAMIDRTEQTAAMHFVDFFAPMMMTDIPFWRYHVEHLSLQFDASLLTVNYFELLQTTFPEAYNACCQCRGDKTRRPCYEFTDLWSPCFRSHASDVSLARFIVRDLGIFSVFGNEANKIPEGVLLADPRLAWVHNNADRWSAHRKLRRCSELCAPTNGKRRGGANHTGECTPYIAGVCPVPSAAEGVGVAKPKRRGRG